ncbi:MAG: transglycosylase SLT domain-containing protein [Nitrospirae bacterium]|nr:transglycosylase SLT domain-containing protein [Nitrospirota bacterium]
MPTKSSPYIVSLLLFVSSSGMGCSTLPAGQAPVSYAPEASPMIAEPAGQAPVSYAPEASPPVAEPPISPLRTEGDAALGNLEDAAEGDTDVEPADESVLDAALELIDASQEHWAAGDRDRAIEALDQAYAIILKVPSDADAKAVQQKEDLRFVISKRLMEIYATRFMSVNGNGKEIPITINDHVEREIRLFQTVERDFFLESYERSGRYREQFAKMIRDAGMPEDLAWLPLIESGFKTKALSRARALGLWQFIPSTGYKFGLKRNEWIDERLDPEKSTRAAIAYLDELHQIFGDWATVLAAYNCGEGNVLRVIRQQKINYLDNFWDLYERLPRETARYYPRFLAVLAIVKDPAKYGFTLEGTDKPLPYEIAVIERPVHLEKLAEKSGCTYEDLAALNLELRHAATPGTAYDLRVPPGSREAVVAAAAALPKWSPPKSSFVVHRVRRGETLSTIAVRYHTSINRIMDANNLKSGRVIRAGQKLKIPLRETT